MADEVRTDHFQNKLRAKVEKNFGNKPSEPTFRRSAVRAAVAAVTSPESEKAKIFSPLDLENIGKGAGALSTAMRVLKEKSEKGRFEI